MFEHPFPLTEGFLIDFKLILQTWYRQDQIRSAMIPVLFLEEEEEALILGMSGLELQIG